MFKQEMGKRDMTSLVGSEKRIRDRYKGIKEGVPRTCDNTLLGFTALFTHHNYPPHFEEVGENSFGVGFA